MLMHLDLPILVNFIALGLQVIVSLKMNLNMERLWGPSTSKSTPVIILLQQRTSRNVQL